MAALDMLPNGLCTTRHALLDNKQLPTVTEHVTYLVLRLATNQSQTSSPKNIFQIYYMTWTLVNRMVRIIHRILKETRIVRAVMVRVQNGIPLQLAVFSLR